MLPIYECVVDEDNFDTGVLAVSFVTYPAVERNFVALSKAKKVNVTRLKVNKKEQILTGPLIIPGKPIYRNSDEEGEHYIVFSKEQIKKIAAKMVRKVVALQTTTHQHEGTLYGNQLVEMWIVSDPKRDKSVAVGLGELPAGTLVVSYKINDKNYWEEEVLTGKVRGFSLEGFFYHEDLDMIKKVKKGADLSKKGKAQKKGGVIPEFLRSVATMLEGATEQDAQDLVEEAAKDETDSGEPFMVFELAEGGEVYVDSEGFCTFDGEQMPAGEHELSDGNFLVIDDEGLMVITQPEGEGEEPSEAALIAARKRGEQYLSGLSKGDEKAKEIARLRAQIAKLEKEPSTPKKKPSTKSEKSFEEMSRTEKMAHIIKQRRKS